MPGQTAGASHSEVLPRAICFLSRHRHQPIVWPILWSLLALKYLPARCDSFLRAECHHLVLWWMENCCCCWMKGIVVRMSCEFYPRTTRICDRNECIKRTLRWWCCYKQARCCLMIYDRIPNLTQFIFTGLVTGWRGDKLCLVVGEECLCYLLRGKVSSGTLSRLALVLNASTGLGWRWWWWWDFISAY